MVDFHQALLDMKDPVKQAERAKRDQDRQDALDEAQKINDEALDKLNANYDLLTEPEKSLMASARRLLGLNLDLSAKQQKWLRDIAARLPDLGTDQAA